MKKMKKYIYGTIIVCLILVMFLYLGHFHNGLSNQMHDWSDFGNYFTGLLSPLLTIINIVVLVELTIAVSDADKSRTSAEIKAQKNLLLLQMRRQSIESFSQIMSHYFNNKYMEEDTKRVVAHVSEYLQTFIKTDFQYFEFGENTNIVIHKIYSLKLNIDIVHDGIVNRRELDHDKYLKIFELKDEILQDLQLNALELVKTDTKNDKDGNCNTSNKE